MEFDRFTIALLVLRPDAPQLDEEAAAALQDAHMAHLADLHEAGHLLSAGPLLGGAEEAFKGLAIFRGGPDEVLRLEEADPAVQAGRFSVTVLPWMAPSGAMAFAPARFPRSMAQARGR
ncbi:YciI family protein [Streptomyces sp. NPDC049040]|uniref:YciI family protein n=1 Tax=Streptomyces sp. NPDC049040 TaxID=3365593 RepID=UPI0037230518